MNALAGINYLAVAVATIVYFFIGFIWYSVLFRQMWSKETGVVKLDFMPDNISWTSKRTMLAAGIKGAVGDCPAGSGVPYGWIGGALTVTAATPNATARAAHKPDNEQTGGTFTISTASSQTPASVAALGSAPGVMKALATCGACRLSALRCTTRSKTAAAAGSGRSSSPTASKLGIRS